MIRQDKTEMLSKCWSMCAIENDYSSYMLDHGIDSNSEVKHIM